MSDEPTVKVPTGWIKALIPLVIAGLVGGGGGSLLSSERLAVLETKVATLERDAEGRREWMVKLGERIRDLERSGGTE